METNKKLAGFAGELGEGFIKNIATDSKDKGAIIKIVLALTGILLLVGSEPFKVLLRKRIDKKALTIESIVLSGVAFILIGGLLTQKELFDGSIGEISKNLWQVVGSFYIILGIGVLICGVKEFRSKNDASDWKKDSGGIAYRGDSLLFQGLIDKGTNPRVIWTIYEPLTCVFAGLLICLIHPLFAIPILATSLSFMLNEIYNVYIKVPHRKSKLTQMHVVANEMRATLKPDEVEINTLRES